MIVLPRLIPCLLYTGRQLVKTVRFAEPTYVGDPVNAVRIFNEREVDEIAILDISASRTGKGPDFSFIKEIVSEAFMPVAYGGGISSIEEIRTLISLGVEKVIISTRAVNESELISRAAKTFGCQSIVVCLDIRKNHFRGWTVYSHCGRKKTEHGPVELARRLTEDGAGELLLNSIDRDGTKTGYDLELIASVSAAIRVPVIASGGARDLGDVRAAIAAGASAAAAGSMFVFHGKHRAVLINYPNPEQRAAAFE